MKSGDDAYRCIAPLCEPLFCIGCNCAVPADVYAVLIKDAERLEWLLHHLSGKEMRRMGIETSSGGLVWGRIAIDAAMAAGVPSIGGSAIDIR